MQDQTTGSVTKRWPLLVAGFAAMALLLSVGAFVYRANPQPAGPTPPGSLPTSSAAPAETAPAASPASTAAVAAMPAAAASPAAKGEGTEASVYEALQQRLDAIAKAYNDGNPQAAERAMWPNHAVVRPNGSILDRSALLGQWMTEWDRFSKRQLSFAIEEVHLDGATVTATWSMELTAEILGPDNEMHEFEARGTQRATYQRSGTAETLAGPIAYLGYEQTIDGMTYKPEE